MTIMEHLMGVALITKKCGLFDNNFFINYEHEYKKRLIFVKLIYLFQSLTDKSLGYSYIWHKDGPYSKAVNGTGYIFQKEGEEYSKEILLKNIKFIEESSNEKLEIFRQKIIPFLDNSDFMEVAASLEFIRKDGISDENLIKELILKKPKFETESLLIKNAISQLSLMREALSN